MSETIEIKPNLSGFLQSFRKIGYKLETAISDIVDNSISAGAKNVRVSMLPSASTVTIFDDGSGMGPATIVEAMRMGTHKDFREAGDLGKFGLGLKTASFSQTKKFTVVSKRDGIISALQWDIDYMTERGDWHAKKLKLSDVAPIIKQVDPSLADMIDVLPSWTVVIWENMDEYSEVHLNEQITPLRNHLSLVFHRFMSKEGYNGRKVAITFNGLRLEPRDPFADTHNATQKNPTEPNIIKGHKFFITAYDLPNHTKLDAKQYDALDMGEGFTRNQGFYLYREGRLLCWGTWFGLAKSSDATSLARIMIDTDNQQDELWNIDVKKSMAEPIPEVKSVLKPYAGKTTVRSRTTKSYRGVKRNTGADWWVEERKDDGVTSLRINREHPLYASLVENFGGIKSVLNEIFNKIESTLPIKTLDAIMNQNPYSLMMEREFNADGLREMAVSLKDGGRDRKKVFELLCLDYDDGEYDKEVNKILDEVFA